MKLLLVAGARPNFMKIASLVHAIKAGGDVDYTLVHTGQHYDKNLSEVFFKQLGIPEPDINLGVGSGSREYHLDEVEKQITPVIRDYKPDWVVVVGDVNSTLASARAAKKLSVKVAHVEAGLRSFDMDMPEEVNRIETDELADYLFVTERSGLENLAHEGVDESKVHFVGNTMIDTLVANLPMIKEKEMYKDFELEYKNYVVATIHRPSNTDTKQALRKVLKIFAYMQERANVLIPLHPRTENALRKFKLYDEFSTLESVTIVPPLGYIEFLGLINTSMMVVTDSGGIQEETTFLGVPCITLRENTERPVTLDKGTNVLVGTDFEKFKSVFNAALSAPLPEEGAVPELWDGKAGERIIKILKK